MRRLELHVRAAEPGDLDALMQLGAELRDQVLPASARTAAARQHLADRYAACLSDSTRHLVVVESAGEVLGMGLMTIGPTHALLDTPAVHLSHAVVAGRARRRGVGQALVGAAAAYAERYGVERLVVVVHPGAREANRFLARLGFAPVDARRAADVSVVRRRLRAAQTPVRRQTPERRPAPARRQVPVLRRSLGPVLLSPAVPVPGLEVDRTSAQTVPLPEV